MLLLYLFLSQRCRTEVSVGEGGGADALLGLSKSGNPFLPNCPYAFKDFSIFFRGQEATAVFHFSSNK